MDNYRVAPDQLNSVMTGILDEYNAEVVKVVNKTSKKAAKELVDKTKRTAFRGHGNFGTRYVDSIASKKLKSSPYGDTYVWYVKSPNYRLSHLLEYGHATVNGGRTVAYHHISTPLTYIEGKYMNDTRRAISAIR